MKEARKDGREGKGREGKEARREGREGRKEGRREGRGRGRSSQRGLCCLVPGLPHVCVGHKREGFLRSRLPRRQERAGVLPVDGVGVACGRDLGSASSRAPGSCGRSSSRASGATGTLVMMVMM